MRLLLFPLSVFALLTYSSCDKEQALLDDVAGEWVLASVDYLTTDGQLLLVDTEGVRFNFETCDSDRNQSSDRCDLTVTLANGEQIFLEFEALRARTQDMRTLQILGTELNSIETDQSLLHQTVVGSFGFEVRGNTLTAVSSRNGASVTIDGQAITTGQFTLRRP